MRIGAWIQRRVVGAGDGPIAVFAADGQYLGTLTPGTPMPLVFISERRVVLQETDQLSCR